ncbi:Organic hydroperoxide resistance transcriptional regulator [Leucobacter aridicollis]|uniref:MarR family winged helix-turn-helix transcriptional regulator n=1 Tax=Leucobacter aridicollis TaxID=283878 RepID=UPI0021697E04|nr:MarR family transcriptional regulator [Leucobacter aridicollis]MCS3428889.1 DNA-binding MarR family transcriptional regulator [Leucobacter aridicollis]
MPHVGQDTREIELADQLTFQLYAASRAMMSAYRKELQPFNLTYTQYLTMRAVWSGDGRPVSDLCAELELDSGTISPLLTRLEASGYISRERVSDDGRQVRVFCTPLGRDLQAQLMHLPGSVAEASAISEPEIERLCGMLGTLREAVRGV